MRDELKSCPWCGNRDNNFVSGGGDEVMVYCGACARGVEGASGDKEDAVEAWNTLPRGVAPMTTQALSDARQILSDANRALDKLLEE